MSLSFDHQIARSPDHPIFYPSPDHLIARSPDDLPLPAALVKKLVKAKIAEKEGKKRR